MSVLLTALLAFGLSSARAQAAPASPADGVGDLVRQAPGLRSEVLQMAMSASRAAASRGKVGRRDILTVIDYSIPSSEPRLFVFDLLHRKLLYRELVAHGKNSGDDRASFFSNSPGSLASCLGLFVTADTYEGHNGYSLRLRGLEEGVNDMAWDRAIVMHGASYVSREAVKVLGRLGRSWGCPAVRSEIAHEIIDTIRGGSAIFAYFPEKSWLATSEYLREVAPNGAAASAAARR